MVKRRHHRKKGGMKTGRSFVCSKTGRVDKTRLTIGKGCTPMKRVQKGRATAKKRFVRKLGYSVAVGR